MMKGWAFAVLGALVAAPAAAADHLVPAAKVGAALSASASSHGTDVARLSRVLSSPAAERVAARMGIDLDRVRGALPALTDAEARDLAARAAVLDRDPAAGLSHDVEELLVIFLIVAIVIVVLKAV